MTAPDAKLNQVLEKAGVSKTIYALVMPETEFMIDRIIDGGDRKSIIDGVLRAGFAATAQGSQAPAELAQQIDKALSQAREPWRHEYREAWTQKQDSTHEEFFATWKKWSAPIVALDGAAFPHMYPTAGASQALHATIDAYGAKALKEGFKPTIHTFIGEYEGFGAYAAAAGIDVVTHDRSQWQEAVKKIGPQDQFYISQPSAIDGNVWKDFENFATALNDTQPSANLMLDLTYVGNVEKKFNVNANHPNIATVFFSLSKPMGAYYHRIGGCLSREPIDSLFGNKWFKSLLALRIGTEMMKFYDVHELPRRYAPLQDHAIAQARVNLGFKLKPSDVYLLATAQPSDNPSDLERYLTRGSGSQALVRVCLTPTLAKFAHPDVKIDSTVRARPHERLEGGPK